MKRLIFVLLVLMGLGVSAQVVDDGTRGRYPTRTETNSAFTTKVRGDSLRVDADSITLVLPTKADTSSVYNKTKTDFLIGLKLSIADTTAMLQSYLTNADVDLIDFYNRAEADSAIIFKGDSIKATIKETYVITLSPGSIATPLDATTYYAGAFSQISPSTTASYQTIIISSSCKLIGFASTFRTGASSQETFSVYVRKNNTTDYLLASNFVTSAGASVPAMNYSNTLDNDYAAGDYIELKIVTPTWVTDPTTWYIRFDLKFQKL